jgi:hypothetical protein
MMWEKNTRVSEELGLANVTPYRLTDPEDGGAVIIRNASDYLTVNRGNIPEDFNTQVMEV